MVTTFGSYDHIAVEGPDEHGVLTLMLNRPDTRNAFTIPMHRELSDVARRLRDPSGIGAVLVGGVGEAFSYGGDVSTIESFTAGPGAEAVMIQEAAEMVVDFLGIAPPVITALQGCAVGLGATFALLADVIFMADDAFIADTHIKVGLVAGDGGTLFWPLLMGPSNAKRYLMTGDQLPAADARRLGLVSEVVPAATVLSDARVFATRLARGPRTAIAWTKAAVNAPIRREAMMHMPMSLAQEARSMHLPDMAEGVRAFLEKRAPRWPSHED